LTLANSYRRLSKDKRRRHNLSALLEPVTSGNLSVPPVCGTEQLGCSSNTEDSGYEAGYETDADESELSEWENNSSPQRHKRKLDALVELTMRLSVSDPVEESEESALDTLRSPPLKIRCALGKPVDLLRLPPVPSEAKRLVWDMASVNGPVDETRTLNVPNIGTNSRPLDASDTMMDTG